MSWEKDKLVASSDFTSLRKRVIDECKTRRSRTGDISSVSKGDVIKASHINGMIDLLNAVNSNKTSSTDRSKGDKLQVIGTYLDGACTVFEAAPTQGNSSQCKTGCVGLCQGCTGSCQGECTSCTGSCTGGCSGSCTGSCTGGCSADCADGCSGSCEDSCSGSCTTDCASGCTGSCENGCEGRGCFGECYGCVNCYGCGDGCSFECGHQCGDSCASGGYYT